MTDRDVQIGKAVTAARGHHSQQRVADAMRDLGHKWSQATVWSVERGDRPLRVTEAEDLAAFLRVALIDLLGYEASSGEAEDRVKLLEAGREAERAVGRMAHYVLEARVALGEWEALSRDVDVEQIPALKDFASLPSGRSVSGVLFELRETEWDAMKSALGLHYSEDDEEDGRGEG